MKPLRPPRVIGLVGLAAIGGNRSFGGRTLERGNTLGVEHRVLRVHVGQMHLLSGTGEQAIRRINIVGEQVSGIAKRADGGVAHHLPRAATLGDLGHRLPQA